MHACGAFFFLERTCDLLLLKLSINNSLEQRKGINRFIDPSI